MLMNKLAIGSLSLGQHESHMLNDKIRIAAQHGFSGVEVVYADLTRYAMSHDLSTRDAALAIKSLCSSLRITVLSLAPFENFEGYNSPLQERLELARQWIDIARALGAIHLQVPAQYSQNCTGDDHIIVAELQQLCNLGTAHEPVVSIAYEPMSWSLHHSTWQSTLDLIKAVNRDNFGLCLDSFHVLTKLWASPYAASGHYPDGDAQLLVSLRGFRDKFPLEKLFYIQLSDAERLLPPISKEHPWYQDGEAAEFTWSKHARPFPGESKLGGYLPVAEFLEYSCIQKGFKGWISMEIFDRRMRNPSFQIESAARRASVSWERLASQTKAIQSNL